MVCDAYSHVIVCRSVWYVMVTASVSVCRSVWYVVVNCHVSVCRYVWYVVVTVMLVYVGLSGM